MLSSNSDISDNIDANGSDLYINAKVQLWT